MIRSKAVPRVEAKLGRDVGIGSIDVGLGSAVLRNITVRGTADGEAPLVHVDRVDVEFGAWSSLVGTVDLERAVVDGVTVAARRDAAGNDNFRDLVARLTGPDAAGGQGGGGGPSLRPKRVALRHLRATY